MGYFIDRKAGLRSKVGVLHVHGPASLILMSKYEVMEFLGGGFPNNIL